MRLIFILLLALAPCSAYAQFDTQSEGLVTNSTEVYTVANIGASANGTAFYFPKDCRAVLFELDATHNGGTTPTMDVKLQHSSDGSTWFDVPSAAFTQITTTSTKYEMHINRQTIKLRAQARIVITLGGTSPDYDATVTMYTD